MRRVVSLCISLFLLFGCSVGRNLIPKETEKSIAEEPVGGLTNLAVAALTSQEDWEEYHFLYPEDTEFYLTELYGVNADAEGLIYTVGGVDAREIAVVYTPDGSGGTWLEAYRENRYSDFNGYAPDQAQLVMDGLVLENGSWAVLLICSDPDAARETLEEWYPELALHPYDPDEVAYDWTQYYDQRGWRIFDPPGDHDMTPYDNSAILAAWRSGDTSGLDETQKAIYDACRTVFSEVVTEDMTDVEKELALHDWLVDHGDYDRTAVGDSKTFQPHADDPYGLLVEGYGICLGYASSFQLLMDLAGVECITVAGAGSGSTRDHAWNMVRLEGEWYCVDVTWDDPVFSGNPVFYPSQWLMERHHKYFNVTSDYMRETDHQWDYDNVPEATATAYSWDNLSGQ